MQLNVNMGLCRRTIFQMSKFLVLVAVLGLACLGLGQLGWSQQQSAAAGQAKDQAKDQKASTPAPRHDISGIWGPARAAGDGIQANGVWSYPDDGKPEHTPPYSALGLKTLEAHKPLFGKRAVLSSLSNDPRSLCDPLGFPRSDFYQIRYEQFIQNDREVAMLYEYEKRWRSIWLDRELPKEIPEQRWYGYSVGKWADDTTLVVQTIGVFGEPKAWLDETGRPLSDDARIEEQFHRVDHDHLEWTVTIDDPKMYTKPWVAMNKFPMKLQSPDFDIWGKYQVEMICSPTDVKNYNDSIGDPASGLNGK
jgi:hypothetical protein